MDITTINANNIELSELLLRVEAGEEIIIVRNGNPIAKLTRMDPDHVVRPDPSIDTGKLV